MPEPRDWASFYKPNQVGKQLRFRSPWSANFLPILNILLVFQLYR